jgi:hypothetical protein
MLAKLFEVLRVISLFHPLLGLVLVEAFLGKLAIEFDFVLLVLLCCL